MGNVLLLLDVGNTSIKLGLANQSQLLASYVLPSKNDETGDSFGLELLDILQHARVCVTNIKACVVSSVVPALDPIITAAMQRYFDLTPSFAGQDLAVPLANHYSQPQEVGADILVGAFEARELFPNADSLIVVDFGTAVTFACVHARNYLGGLIFPGPGTALWALSQKAAKLPQISMSFTEIDPVPGRNTVTSIQHGLVFGYAVMTDGLCSKLAAQLPGSCQIVATGGFAQTIAPLTCSLKNVIPSLLLNGLARLYQSQTVNA